MAVIPDAAPRIIAAKKSLNFLMFIYLGFGCAFDFKFVFTAPAIPHTRVQILARRLCIFDNETHPQLKD
ncbi:MAG: hypothetical protein V3R79_02835 [Alphaproteobacteria bacterium]